MSLPDIWRRSPKLEHEIRSPSLGLVLGFWGVTSVLVVVWWHLVPDMWLPGGVRSLGVAFFVLAALAPLALLFAIRKSFLNPVVLGLLVSCSLAFSLTAHEANLLRDQMQFSLDHEREFAHLNLVEGIIRPLISKVVETYVRILGDSHSGRSTYVTHIAINYMFDSVSFLAVFALATLLLSPTATWLCLLTFAFYAQMAMFVGRMGSVFIAGGLAWQLFLLISRRYPAAIFSGLIISFARTDVVFASAFVLLSLAAFERRWLTAKEWCVLGALVGISLLVPKILIAMHPQANFQSFLVAQGDYFTKMVGNLLNVRLAVAIASPLLAILIITTVSVTRTVAAVVPPALIHIGIVFLIADFSEVRLIVPTLGALTFVTSEALGRLLVDRDGGRPDARRAP